MKTKEIFRTSNVFYLFDVKSKNKRELNFYTSVKEGKASEMNHFQISLFTLEQNHHLKNPKFLPTIKFLFPLGNILVKALDHPGHDGVTQNSEVAK